MTIRYNIDGKDRVHVESYTLYEWVEEVQEVSRAGYKLCLENDRFPHSYVGYYSAYFDKEESRQGWEDKFDTAISDETQKDQEDILFVDSPMITLSEKDAEWLAQKLEQTVNKEKTESPTLSAEEFEKAEGLVDALEEKVNEAIEQLEQSPAEQVNNQDADVATDIGAFPERTVEPVESIVVEAKDTADRPARRGRPPRNAQ